MLYIGKWQAFACFRCTSVLKGQCTLTNLSIISLSSVIYCKMYMSVLLGSAFSKAGLSMPLY